MRPSWDKEDDRAFRAYVHRFAHCLQEHPHLVLEPWARNYIAFLSLRASGALPLIETERGTCFVGDGINKDDESANLLRVIIEGWARGLLSDWQVSIALRRRRGRPAQIEREKLLTHWHTILSRLDEHLEKEPFLLERRANESSTAFVRRITTFIEDFYRSSPLTLSVGFSQAPYHRFVTLSGKRNMQGPDRIPMEEAYTIAVRAIGKRDCASWVVIARSVLAYHYDVSPKAMESRLQRAGIADRRYTTFLRQKFARLYGTR
jgi:hypothetical protein